MDWRMRLAVLMLIIPTDGDAQMFSPVLDTDRLDAEPRRRAEPEIPAFALEEQFRELSEKSRRLQAEREELSIAMEQIEAASVEINGLELALAEANQALTDLKKAGLEARTGLKSGGLGGSGISDRLTTRIYAFFGPMEAPDRVLQNKLNTYSPGRMNATPAQAYVTDIVTSLLSDFFRRRRTAEAFPAMGRISSFVDFVDRSRSNPSAEEVENLLREIEQVDQGRMQAVFNESRAAALKILTSLNAKLAEEKKNKDAKWGDIQPRLARINESMRLRTEQKDALDKGLVWAIYGMIFALLLLFIGLRFFPADTAAKLIENRSLVEIISMAFILLTIIILGTGDKLGKETLGTLLGTIAGYIFGQKMGAQTSGRNQG